MPLSRTCRIMASWRAGKLSMPEVPKCDKNSVQCVVAVCLATDKCVGMSEALLTLPRNSSQWPVGGTSISRTRACNSGVASKVLLLNSTMHQLSPLLALRRSNVNGNSGLAANSMLARGMAMRPGVWPIRKNRAKRRLSASKALTGSVS